VLTPADQVRNLLGRYCDLADAGDWSGIGALFATGKLTSGGHVLAEGADAVAAFYAGGTRRHDHHGGSPRTKHLVLNTQLSTAPPDLLVGRSSYVVLQAVEGAIALQPIITGRYTDTFQLTAGTAPVWIERAFEVDLTGDLTHHLTWTLDTGG
jgi:SnoaL-like domain